MARRARRNTSLAGDLLLAFRDGDSGVKGQAGSMFIAEFMQSVLVTLLKGDE